MKKRRLELLPLGMLIGFFFGMLLAMLLDIEVFREVKSNWVDFATIFSAIAAAYLALLSTSWQIQAGSEEHDRERLRSLTMSKAMSPNALSEMIRVARNGIKFGLNCTHEQLEDCGCNRVFDLSPETLALTANLIRDAEATDAEKLAKLVRMFQVMKAREERAIRDRFDQEPNVVIIGNELENLDRAVT